MTEDLHIYQVEDGWLETYSGQQFHFLEPAPEEIHIDDVAHALSMLCRYNGHTKAFYSVAEHSVLVADWIRDNYSGASQRVCRTALMHDLPETYLGDMSRPVKHVLPYFKELEAGIEFAAAIKFDLEVPPPVIIKECDRRVTIDERAQCMSDSGHKWLSGELEPLGVEIKFLDPPNARKLFLERFSEYSG